MANTGSHARGYVLAAAMGAIAGGLAVALATKAIPKTASQLMQNIMAHMREAGFNPAEM
jgi:hypothetical protein